MALSVFGEQPVTHQLCRNKINANVFNNRRWILLFFANVLKSEKNTHRRAHTKNENPGELNEDVVHT